MKFIEQLSNNWIFAVLIAPVVVGFFKKEISDFLGDLKIYRNRAFNVGDEVDLLNPNIGAWGKVKILDYDFNLAPAGRVVTVQHNDGHIEDIPFKAWAAMRKAAHVTKE